MTETRLIDGKAIAAELRQAVARKVSGLGLKPGLAAVLVGNDKASETYIRNKAIAADAVGIAFFEHRLPASATTLQIMQLVGQLNNDSHVHGILVQLPLPSHIDKNKVLHAIDPNKDADGIHPLNAGLLAQGTPDVIPCTPLGCSILLKRTLGSIDGKNALVVGRSNIVGRPMAQVLLMENCTVTTAHSHTRNLEELVRLTDILVVATGCPGLIRGSWLKPGATVIDVGINYVQDTAISKPRIVGDVNTSETMGIANAITPVPGGVGPMTVACLLFNTLQLAAKKFGKKIQITEVL